MCLRHLSSFRLIVICTLSLRCSKELADKISKVTVDIVMGHGQDGRLYGSVTAKDIAEELKKILGADVDKRKINIKEPIKAYGSYDIEIKLLQDINAKFVVKVHG